MAPDPGPPARAFDDLLRGESAAGLADGDLLARFAAGRGCPAEAAFAALVARHGPLVWGVCRRALADPADADDAFQATFLVLARRAGSVRVDGSLGRWLHGVARRVAAKARARRARRRRREGPDGPLARAAVPPPDPAHAEALAALDDAVARLPEPFRSAVVLCDLAGLTHEQAAAELGCPVGTVKSRLARGRGRLRARLAARGFRPDAAPLSVPPALLGATVRLAGSRRTIALALAADLRRLAPLTPGVDPMMIASAATRWLVGLALGLGLTAAGLTLAPGQAPPAPTPPPAASPAALKPPAPADPDATEVTVEARDAATDAPVAGVSVHLEGQPSGQVELAATDGAGLARFPVRDSGKLTQLKIWTDDRDGLVPLAVRRWFDNPGPTLRIRDRFVLRVERGVPIGGRVVDPAGRPIAGATVVVEFEQGNPDVTNQFIHTSPVATDADGRWSIPFAPAHPDRIKVAAHHPLHRTDDLYYHVEEVRDRAAPAAGTLVTILPERGTSLEGVVVDPLGRPVADAEVSLGGGQGYSNTIPPVRTDGEGRFRFAVRPGARPTLIASHPGFGPVGMKVAVGTDPQRVTLSLPAAATLAGAVVDPAGKPIPNAQVTLTWEPGELEPTKFSLGMPIGRQIRTDAAGRFAWTEAPPGAALAEVWTGDSMKREGLVVTAGAANRITLTRPARIRAAVVDAATGQPIADFHVFPGTNQHPGGRLIWQEEVTWGAGGSFVATRTGPGTFEIGPGLALHELAVRVSAADHLAATSEAIPMDGATHDVTLRLVRASPLVGRVVRPDGSPATGVTVYLDRPDDSHRMNHGVIDDHEARRMIHAAVGPDGSFRLPPQREPFALVALGDAGVALLPVGGFRPDQAVTLQPWASVGGTCKLADGPGEGFFLSRDQDDPTRSAEAGYPTQETIWVNVDSSGRYAIPRLTPGRHTLGRWVANNADGRRWFQALAVVDLRPGEAKVLDIGGTGRPATGRLRLPALPPGQAPMLRLARVEPVAPAEPDYQRGARLLPDGRFRVENLAPGTYQVRLSVHEPPPGRACGWGRLLGRFDHTFAIPDGPARDPVDLGTLEPVEAPAAVLQPGDPAPDFRVAGLDGQPVALADLRGRVVLVDFWATWCAPCLAELPTLKAIHREFAADPRFRLVSVSLDEDAKPLRAMVAAEQLAWPQAPVGPESPVVAAYGATAVPATFLIGPDGRVVARDLRGDDLRAAIRRALGRP